MNKLLDFEESHEFETTLQHGDIIQVISHERLCGLPSGAFTALIVESKDDGLIAIPQDFYAHMALAENDACGWEIDLGWLLETTCEVRLVYSYQGYLEKRKQIRESVKICDEVRNSITIPIEQVNTLDEEFEFLESLDIKEYLLNKQNDLNVIERIEGMIFNRLETLWENTWIDGYIRENTDGELTEWKRLNEMQEYINTVVNGESKSDD